MNRLRIPVLVALAVIAVVAFLLGPQDGLLARVPVMVLCGVLALIWHLCLQPSGVASVSPTEPVGKAAGTPSAPPAEHRPGYFEVEESPAAAPSAEAAPPEEVPPAPPGRVEEVSQPLPVLPLSALPDPPANWPPGGVQVPRVFQLTGGEPSPEDGPGTSDPDDSDPDVIDPDVIDLGVIDLGVIDLEVADPQIIDLTDPGPLPEMEPPPEMAEVPTSVDDDHAVGATTASNAEDPWLAFAAAMFRDD